MLLALLGNNAAAADDYSDTVSFYSNTECSGAPSRNETYETGDCVPLGATSTNWTSPGGSLVLADTMVYHGVYCGQCSMSPV